MSAIGIDWGEGRRAGTVAAYRGPDRRRAASAAIAPGSRTLLVALGLLVSASVVVAVAAIGTPHPHDLTQSRSTDWLAATASSLAALAGAVYAMRWRLVGEAAALWVATALFVYSAMSVALPRIVESLSPTGEMASWTDRLRPASVFVVIVLLTIGVASHAVDARVRPRRTLLIAGIVLVTGVVLADVSPVFRVVLGPAVDRVPASGFGGQAGIALIWLALGIGFLYRSLRRAASAGAWVGIMLIALAESRLALGLSVARSAPWVIGSQLFRTVGVTAALIGGFRELQTAFVEQRSRLLDSLLELESSEARQRAERACEAERTHDVRAALAGIGGAALTLEHYSDRLTVEERTKLATAVSAEIARLQQIVSQTRDRAVRFRLGDALRAPLKCAETQGLGLDVDVPRELTAFGRPAEVAEAVQNLLDNARRHATGSRVAVSATRQGGWATIRVEDRGPGVRTADRSHVFERGWRGPTAAGEGSGLGLFVAAKLLRDQGGDVWVEERPGGGASFVIAMPAERRDIIE